jgi:hypothetical protein
MANKNKGKVIQMLSPENYIRKKSRSLPFYECWVNEDWEDSGMANIIIARIHTNGNITFCVYLVDLLCLGVKDSFYNFNITETEYRNCIEKFSSEMEIELVEYPLVHNIIFTALEFAKEFGFKPHKDFTSVTEYMLEEDTDDIELIEIKCGKNGKPLYVQGPYDDEAKANKIMKQLERTAGLGNFDFIKEFDFEDDDDFNEDDWDVDDWDDEDEEDLDNDEYDDWDEVEHDQVKDDELPSYSVEEIEKSKKLIAELLPRMDKLKSKEIQQLATAMSVISASLCEADKVREAMRYFEMEFEKVEITDEIPDEMLGIENQNLPNCEKIKDIFIKGYKQDRKKLKKAISKLRDEAGEIAGVDILELLYLEPKGQKPFLEKLEQSYSDFPDNPMIKTSYLIEKLVENKQSNITKLENLEIQDIFGNRKIINRAEWYFYLLLLLFNLRAENDPSKLFSFINIMNKQDLYEEDLNDLRHIAMMIQFDSTLKNLRL